MPPRAQPERNFEALAHGAKTACGLSGPDAERRRQPPPQRSFRATISTAGILVPGIYNLAERRHRSDVHERRVPLRSELVVRLGRRDDQQVWTVEATGRNDWSSTLPKENASYFYPSVSSSLVLSDMFPTLANDRWLSYLKLRGGWARVGSDAGRISC